MPVGACVLAPPILPRPVPPDSAPFYFPSGVTPPPGEVVLVDLARLDTRTFSLQVFDTDAEDRLEYAWRVISPALDIVPTVGSGVLRSPVRLGRFSAWQVPTLTLQACRGTFAGFLSRDGDELTFELTIRDEIPPDQRFDAEADAYTLVVRWRVVALGSCL
jgi:hypothetical protein